MKPMVTKKYLTSNFFFNDLGRAELYENKRVFLKAVRVTLISLGYDESWVNDQFRDLLESYFGDVPQRY